MSAEAVFTSPMGRRNAAPFQASTSTSTSPTADSVGNRTANSVGNRDTLQPRDDAPQPRRVFVDDDGYLPSSYKL